MISADLSLSDDPAVGVLQVDCSLLHGLVQIMTTASAAVTGTVMITVAVSGRIHENVKISIQSVTFALLKVKCYS